MSPGWVSFASLFALEGVGFVLRLSPSIDDTSGLPAGMGALEEKGPPHLCPLLGEGSVPPEAPSGPVLMPPWLRSGGVFS